MNARYILCLLFATCILSAKIVLQSDLTTHTLMSEARLIEKKTTYEQFKSLIPDYTFSGYIKAESFFDTRQMISAADAGLPDLYPYFPADKMPDSRGQDKNANGQAQFDAFDTRLRVTLSDIELNKKTILKGLIETNLYAISLSVPNIFFLRHMRMQLDRKNATILLGLTNHPIAFPIPNTIDFNGLFPFDFYARSVQCTCTYHIQKDIDIIISANSQSTFQTAGPANLGPLGIGQIFTVNYTKNAIVPNIHFQARFQREGFTTGAGIDYSRFAPQISTNNGFSTNAALNSLSGVTYFLIERPTYYVHTKLMIGQNPVQYNALGGYAVKKDSIDPITNKRQYTNLNTLSAWTDIAFNLTPRLQPGLFAGFQKALGASSPIELNIPGDIRVYGFGTNVNASFRISPRIIIQVGSINLAIEVEYTRAQYGTLNENGRIEDVHSVSNTRTTFASYYFF